jgi:hypothetical protein
MESEISRRGFLRVSLGAAVASSGAYGMIEQLATKPARFALASARASASLPREQYLFSGTETVIDNGVGVSVPPLYHEVVTATLASATTAADLKAGHTALEGVLTGLEKDGLLTFTPAGLGLAVGWGLTYFDNPALAGPMATHMPLDKSAPKVNGSYQKVLLAAKKFATDPATVILEKNDVVVVLASDSLANIATAYNAVFQGPAAGLFKVTSRRKGFVDATKLGTGGVSLTKQFALANKLPGAASIPDQAQLFLGFTSTQQAAEGPGTIANFESLGMTDQTPKSYFAYGTTLALSHLYENIATWYANNVYADRVNLAFRPGLKAIKNGTLTIPESASDAETTADLVQDIGNYGIVGHSGSMQPISRLQSATGGFAAGTAIPVRADFNTVDNPFAFSAYPTRDHWSASPSAGVHFLSYVPTSYYFQLLRGAMDGQGFPGGSQQYFHQFLNAADITTTHRQNFLIPPRAHRSFPLAELL